MFSLATALTFVPLGIGGAIVESEKEKYLQERFLQEGVYVTESVINLERQGRIFDEQHAELRIDDDTLFNNGLLFSGMRNVVVRFKHRPQIVVHDGKYFIPTWSRIDSVICGNSFDSLGVEMRRLIVRLHAAAQHRAMDQKDMVIWQHVLHDIDYADYCDQIRPALPTIGRRLRSSGDSVLIRMVGGKEEELRGELAKSLDFVKDGERFTVLFKRMRGQIVVFENVCPLNEVDVSRNDKVGRFFT